MFEIASHLQFLRKKEGKTQQEVAHYIGVSTAAVSKWETGQSYPDIMILPKLATYYNVSIDEILRYEPQMSKENIQKLYAKLAKDFQQQPFDDVLAEIQKIIKEYYSCSPLLMQLAILLLNYLQLAQQQTTVVFDLINELCERIQQYTEDNKQLQLSRSLQAQVALMTNQPEKVLTILGEQIEPYAGNDLLLANAYMMLKKEDEAVETYQISIFQKVISTLSLLSNYLAMQTKEPIQFQQSIARGLGMIELFELKNLHINSCLVFYVSAAIGYLAMEDEENSLTMLDYYQQAVIHSEFPITLHGDAYFHKIDAWIIRELDLGQATPTDEATIRQNILNSLELHPALSPLKGHRRFKTIIRQLKHHLGVN